MDKVNGCMTIVRKLFTLTFGLLLRTSWRLACRLGLFSYTRPRELLVEFVGSASVLVFSNGGGGGSLNSTWGWRAKLYNFLASSLLLCASQKTPRRIVVAQCAAWHLRPPPCEKHLPLPRSFLSHPSTVHDRTPPCR